MLLTKVIYTNYIQGIIIIVNKLLFTLLTLISSVLKIYAYSSIYNYPNKITLTLHLSYPIGTEDIIATKKYARFGVSYEINHATRG